MEDDQERLLTVVHRERESPPSPLLIGVYSSARLAEAQAFAIGSSFSFVHVSLARGSSRDDDYFVYFGASEATMASVSLKQRQE